MNRCGQVDLIAVPDVGVGGNHGIGGGSVYLVEETTTKDVRRFVFFGGVELGGLPGSHHLGLGQRSEGPFVFLAIGVLGLGVLADSQGEDQGDVGCGLDGFEQSVEEGRELTTGPRISPFHLPQVDGDLVDHDEGGLAPEQLPDRLSPWGDVLLVALLDPSIAFGPGQSVGKLTPEGLGPQIRARGSARRRGRCSRRPGPPPGPVPLGKRAGSTNSSTLSTPGIPRTA